MKGWIEYTEIRKEGRRRKRSVFIANIDSIGEADQGSIQPGAPENPGFIVLRSSHGFLIFTEESYQDLRQMIAQAIGELAASEPIKNVQRLKVDPDEIIILSIKEPIELERATSIRDVACRSFGTDRVLVLTNGIEVSVAKIADLPDGAR